MSVRLTYFCFTESRVVSAEGVLLGVRNSGLCLIAIPRDVQSKAMLMSLPLYFTRDEIVNILMVFKCTFPLLHHFK